MVGALALLGCILSVSPTEAGPITTVIVAGETAEKTVLVGSSAFDVSAYETTILVQPPAFIRFTDVSSYARQFFGVKNYYADLKISADSSAKPGKYEFVVKYWYGFISAPIFSVTVTNSVTVAVSQIGIAKSATNVVLTWPASVALKLESAPTFSASGPWTVVTDEPQLVNLEESFQLTLSADGPARCFRLRK